MLKRFQLLKSLIGKRVKKRVAYYSSATRSVQDAHPLSNERTRLQAPEIIIPEHEFKYSVGQQYNGFECIRCEYIPDFSITSYIFRNVATGTELWYLDRKDPNKVFSINFRTNPCNSTGLPHILEHSVLCGSEKYPVRDPFFKMLNRSVATFMNALTGPDYTMFPFSSINDIDFRNLQQIYLDAVFRPNLEYLDFLQEGWRLEHSDINDPNSEYVIKGVVYNEMKGAFSENYSVFSQNLLNNLLPDHTYGHVSGGNPLEIPKLTHANLIDFHRKYYHPSNARIYMYGSLDLNKSLAYVHDNYLSKYEYVDNSFSYIPNQTRWDKPRNVHISSRYDTMGAPFEKQNQIAIALLLSDVTNIEETFVLYVLSELLIRGPNSPFYRNLIEPNLSGGYNQTTGFDPQLRDTYFTVGLQDLHVEDFSAVQEIYKNTIDAVMDKGFDGDHIESILHNIELSLKHQSPQFGLGLLFNSTPLWNHNGDIVRNLRVSHMIKQFRQHLREDRSFLQSKIEQYFTNNNHRLTLTMSADDTYEENFKQAELNILKQKIMSLDSDKRKEIYENGIKLMEAQKAVPKTELLPCLRLEDVQQAPKVEPLDFMKLNQVPTQVCNINTNGISYLKCYFDGTSLTDNEILLIPLFCNIINDMGTKNYNYRDFDKVVVSKTGGIDFKLHFAENVFDGKSYTLGVLMTTHALDKNVPAMFDLCKELLCNFALDDEERIKMLVHNYISNIAVGIVNSGHMYAMQSCAGLITDAGRIKSMLAGIEHINYMKNYEKNNTPAQIIQQMNSLGSKLFDKGNMRTAINTSNEYYSEFMQHYKNFLSDLIASKAIVKKIEKTVNFLESSCQHFILNVPVNYCAQAFYAVPYAHRDHPALRLLAKYISAKYLLPVVREQNGAYGAGAKIDSDGIFSYFSYRDPNSVQTLGAFDNTYKWLKENENLLTEQNIFEAKLGVLQQLDAPIAPGNVGIDFFLYGVSQDMFLKYRSRLLAVTINELRETIQKYFQSVPEHFGKCVLGPENKDLQKLTKLEWKITKN